MEVRIVVLNSAVVDETIQLIKESFLFLKDIQFSFCKVVPAYNFTWLLSTCWLKSSLSQYRSLGKQSNERTKLVGEVIEVASSKDKPHLCT